MFSVIIPLYNKAPYLQRALDSVYAQSFPVGEIMVVDDGSTDGGERIARAQSDPRVRVLEQPHKGVGAARNTGIDSASYPYLAFLDADDMWLPGYLERMREMVMSCPGAALYGTGFATVAEGRELRRYGVHARAVKSRGAVLTESGHHRPAFGPVDFFKEWRAGHIIHTSSMVVPCEVARALGGFPEGVTHGEDLEFWAKLALAGDVILSPDVLTRYDVGVSGQAVEYWSKGYRETFDILAYHRFLARKLGGRTGEDVGGEKCAVPGFRAYGQAELRKALLQRMYWGDMKAAERFCSELALDEGGFGASIAVLSWISEHECLYPGVRLLAQAVRYLRG